MPTMVAWLGVLVLSSQSGEALVTRSGQSTTPRCVRARSSPEDEAEAKALKAAFRRAAVEAKVKNAERTARSGELGFRDKRVQSAQEPQNELRELTENSRNWGLLGLGGLVSRFGAIFLVVASITWLLTDNYDTYNELVDLTVPQRATLSALLGSAFALASAARLLAQWTYVAGRLSEKTLYFEQTGWADPFSLEKPENTAFRDQLLYEDEVAPRVQTIRSAAAIVATATALALASVVVVWIL
mmetsp:Transcript_21720/g.68040  ORF Transcript_21720/g.68040 Transcript_21720/m.68040 type:complete len:243 (-) Transcript_21720:24-752(-)